MRIGSRGPPAAAPSAPAAAAAGPPGRGLRVGRPAPVGGARVGRPGRLRPGCGWAGWERLRAGCGWAGWERLRAGAGGQAGSACGRGGGWAGRGRLRAGCGWAGRGRLRAGCGQADPARPPPGYGPASSGLLAARLGVNRSGPPLPGAQVGGSGRSAPGVPAGPRWSATGIPADRLRRPGAGWGVTGPGRPLPEPEYPASRSRTRWGSGPADWLCPSRGCGSAGPGGLRPGCGWAGQKRLPVRPLPLTCPLRPPLGRAPLVRIVRDWLPDRQVRTVCRGTWPAYRKVRCGPVISTHDRAILASAENVRPEMPEITGQERPQPALTCLNSADQDDRLRTGAGRRRRCRASSHSPA